MPNIKSAKKRVLVTEIKNARNRAFKTALKTSLKKFDAAEGEAKVVAYKEAVKSCDCRELIRIINTALKRKEERLAHGKKMSACDERYLKQAQDTLYGEFAISLKIDKGEVQDFIMNRIEMKSMASAS